VCVGVCGGGMVVKDKAGVVGEGVRGTRQVGCGARQVLLERWVWCVGVCGVVCTRQVTELLIIEVVDCWSY
jgi:hypothetical protein